MTARKERELAPWIVIPGWDEFVHPDVTRSKNAPAWLKLRPALHHDDAYMGLTGNDRAVLISLWMEYAASGCRLRADTRSVSSRIGLRVTKETFERLNHAGFILFSASSLQADCKQPASLELKTLEQEPRAVTATRDGRRARANGAAADVSRNPEPIPWP